MSSIPTSDPNDSDNISHGNYDDLNEKFYDFDTSDNITNSSNVIRYTRAALYILRNDSRSRRRPECALRTDLQNLGVWKFSTVNSIQNGNINGVNDGAIGGQSGQHINTRAQRSPSTRSVSSDHSVIPSVHNLMQYKIDHRSISSSHLMPAFAKRRIVTSTVAQNVCGNSSSYEGNSPSELRSETPTKGKDNISYGGGRQRGKENVHDYRQRRNDDHSSYLSPQRKSMGEHERERLDRTHEHDHHSSSASSPVSLTNSRHGHYNNIIQERRIGSGRLLPRDVSWDCRGQEKEKNQVNSLADKELSSHLLQQRNSGRFSERSHERSGYNNDRRYSERRGGGGNDEFPRDKYDNMNNSSSNTHNNRRFTTNEMTNNAESSSSHQHQSTHNRGRRNHQYNDRNEEPEWFSSGPTSQHDTIELRGFEEMDEHCISNGSVSRRSTASAASKLSESSSSHASSSLNISNQKSIQSLKGLVGKDTDTKLETLSIQLSTNAADCAAFEEKNIITDQVLERGGDNNNNDNDEVYIKFEDALQTALKKSENDENIASKFPKEAELNFDAFLNPNLDPLNHTLMRGDSHIGNDIPIIGNSRFSRWFGPKTNGNDLPSTAGNEMQNVKDSNEAQNKSQTNTLMEFLQLSKLPTNLLPEGSNQHVAGIPSVEELEARMRKMDIVDKGNENGMDVSRAMESDISNNNNSHAQQPSREAFKKLLERLGSGNKGQPQSQPQPSMQMNILMQQPNYPVSVPQINMMHPGGLVTTRLPQSIPSHMLKNEEVKKFMQQQQMLNQHQQTQIHTVIPPSLVIQHHTMPPNNPQTGNEISMPPPHIPVIFPGQKRLEAQYLFQCVARGEISLNLLEQELNHPNTPSRAKEVIAAVLRESSRSATPSTGMSTNIPLPQPLNTNTSVHQQHHIHSPNPMGVSSQHGNIGLQNPQMTGPVMVSVPPPDQRPLPQGLPTSGEINMPDRFVKPESLMKTMEQEQEHEWLKKVNESKEERQKHQQQQKQKEKTQQKQQPNMINPSLNEIDAQQKSLQQQMSMQPSLQTGHQQSHPSHALQQQPRHINSPTPLAFTPTSVLRKMTADKDNTNNTHQQQATVTQNSQNKLLAQTTFVNQNQQLMQQPQPRMILGGNHSQQQQQLSNDASQISPQNISQQQQPPLQQLRNPPMKWQTHGISQNMGVNKSMGRPILKGPLTTPQPQQQQISQLTFASNIEFQQIQQQQRLKNNRTPQHILNQPSQQFPPHPLQQQPQSHNMIAHVQQQQHQQQLFQQHQQRAMALQRQQQLQLQQQLHQHHPIQQQQPQQILDTSNRPMGISGNSDSNLISTTNTTGGIINYQRDGGLSPTSNQLAQWFSPELLAQASAGKLPLLNMNQALSLEEFERSIQHSSTAVHN